MINAENIIKFFESKGYILSNRSEEGVVTMRYPSREKFIVTLECDGDDVLRVDVDGPIVTGTNDEDAQCIRLVKEVGEFENLPLTMENLETAVRAQFNPTKHSMSILRSHLKNMEVCYSNYIPLLEKFDFMESYNSLMDCIRGEGKVSSDLIASYMHPNDTWHTINFTTNALTGDFEVSYIKMGENKLEGVDHLTVTEEELRKVFHDRVFYDDIVGDVDDAFLYLYDERETIKTYPMKKRVFSLNIKRIKEDELSPRDIKAFHSIDVSVLPKDYLEMYDAVRVYVERGMNHKNPYMKLVF